MRHFPILKLKPLLAHARRAENYLFAMLFAVMVFRVIYVYVAPPMAHIYSDPGRHWQNGTMFLRPYIFGSIDPFLYQAWVFLAQLVSLGNAHIVSAFAALTSALLPFFWYLALREILPRNWALAGGVLIGLTPSLVMIYGYFMNETLLLTLMGAAIWLSLRSFRLRTLMSFSLAAGVWALAVYTRMTALPVAGLMLAALFLSRRGEWLERGAIAGLFFFLLMLPACWHSSVNLRFCAPFGMPHLATAYRASQYTGVEVDIIGHGRFGFVSPGYIRRPLSPISEWKPEMIPGNFPMQVNPANGEADWLAAIEKARAVENKPLSRWQDLLTNMRILYFDASWPDDNPGYLMGWLNIKTRWMWAPLSLFVLVGFPLVLRRLRLRASLLPLAALLIMAALTFQRTGMMEGRYRKPAEPLLIAAALVVLHARVAQRRHPLNTILPGASHEA